MGSGTPITATDWTLDNWGETLLACPVGGPIYYWTPRSGFSNAQVVTTGPFANQGIFVAMPQQILVAYGSEQNFGYGVQGPLTVRWSDVGNFTLANSWVASTQTQAGSFPISSGSRIIGGLQGPTVAYIWTDIDVWTMTYIGYPGVFGFLKISSGCGLIAQHACGTIGTSVYWMGTNQFYVANGGSVRSVPCTVWDFVFQDLDTDNAYKIRCGINSMFDEVSWFFPSLSGGTGENDKYVKYNVKDNLWDCGSIIRTAWIDQSVLGPPIGADSAQFIYQHETSPNANGQPMNWFVQTGYFMISEGTMNTFSDMVFPDFRYGDYNDPQDATVLVTVNGIDYPSDSVVSKGPYTMDSSTKYFTARMRKRQLSLLIQGGDLNSFVRQGNLRIRTKDAGRR